jgi:hypothetical protein
MSFAELGKWLVIAGLGLALLGGVMCSWDTFPWQLGDITFKRRIWLLLSLVRHDRAQHPGDDCVEHHRSNCEQVKTKRVRLSLTAWS